MATTHAPNLQPLANALMRAVVASGCIRSADQDAAVACKVMREELKALLDPTSGRYADERALALEGRSGLALASVAAECINRILKERAA